jgi:hypothetical protein
MKVFVILSLCAIFVFTFLSCSAPKSDAPSELSISSTPSSNATQVPEFQILSEDSTRLTIIGYDADKITYGTLGDNPGLYYANPRFLSGLETASVEGSANWESDTVISVFFIEGCGVPAGTLAGPAISFKYDSTADTILDFRVEPFVDMSDGGTEYFSSYNEADALIAGREFFKIMTDFEEFIKLDFLGN